MAGTADLGTLVLRLTADNRSFDASLLSSMARAAGFAAGVVSSITAVTAVAYKATKAYADFEDGMTKSLSIMSKEDQKFRQQMEETALQLSTESTTAAADLAKGYYYLASAGLDAAQSMKALSVANNFAIAGDMKLEQATETLTDSVANLGLATKDATQYQKNMIDVSNALAQAGAISNASTEQFAIALRTKAGAALRTFNKDVYEGTAVLMAFANQGIKAENGGESLNIVMRDLARTAIHNRQAWADFGVSVFDAQGEMRNLPTIFTEMEDAMASYSPEQRKAELALLGFQDRTISATNALIGMGREMASFEAQQRAVDANYAKDVAARQMMSFNAQLDILLNNITKVGIALASEWMPEMRALISVMQDFTKEMDANKQGVADFGTGGANALQGFVSTFLLVIGLANTFVQGLRAIAGGMLAIAGIAGQGISAVGALSDADSKNRATAAIADAYERMNEARKAGEAEEEAFWDKRYRALQAQASKMDRMREDDDTFRKTAEAFTKEGLASVESAGQSVLNTYSKLIDMQASFSAKADAERAKQRAMQEETRKRAAEAAEAAKRAAFGPVGVNRAAAGLAMSELTNMRSNASAKAQNVDPTIAGLYSGLDPYKAQSESVSTLIRIQEKANKSLADNQKLKDNFLITDKEYTKNLETQQFTLQNYSNVLAQMNLKGELTDPWEAGAASLSKYDQQYKNSQARFAAASKETQDFLKASTISLDAYQRKRAEIMAQAIPSLGKNQGRPGFDIGATAGQEQYDYTRYQSSGIQGMDSMYANSAAQQQLKQQYDDELAQLDHLYSEKEKKDKEYIDKKTALDKEYADRKKQFDLDQASLALQSSQSIGDSLTSIAADTAGKQSGIYKSMFAMSKAFAIADASVKIAQGIAAASANPFPYNLAAMASVAAATASIVSNIMSVRMTSFEGGGMTPGGNRTGGVDGRGGMLSVLHPNEMVVDLDKPSNRNQGMGGPNITVINNAPGYEPVTKTSEDGKNIEIVIQKTIKQIASEIRTGKGPVPSAMAETYGLQRGK